MKLNAKDDAELCLRTALFVGIDGGRRGGRRRGIHIVKGAVAKGQGQALYQFQFRSVKEGENIVILNLKTKAFGHKKLQ